MNIAVLDDYQDTIRSLACFSKVAGHNVTIVAGLVQVGTLTIAASGGKAGNGGAGQPGSLPLGGHPSGAGGNGRC